MKFRWGILSPSVDPQKKTRTNKISHKNFKNTRAAWQVLPPFQIVGRFGKHKFIIVIVNLGMSIYI
jgi:hypothetical protein